MRSSARLDSDGIGGHETDGADDDDDDDENEDDAKDDDTRTASLSLSMAKR